MVSSMSISKRLPEVWNLRCLHCRGALTSDTSGLACAGCSRQYPIIAGIPLLVSEPIEYLRSELELLNRAVRDGKRRRGMLDKGGRDTGLTKASLDRHRDVIDAELARAATFLSLLEPVAKMLEGGPGSSAESRGVGGSGWVFVSFVRYVLRRWAGTTELEVAD